MFKFNLDFNVVSGEISQIVLWKYFEANPDYDFRIPRDENISNLHGEQNVKDSICMT